MKIDKSIKHTGKWFLPHSSIELSGKLVINRQKNQAELKLYSSCDINGIEIKSDIYTPQDYNTICGRCDLSYQFTLTECRFKSASYFIDNLYEIVYEPNFTYTGGVFFNGDKTLATQLTCKFPYLSDWYDTNQLFFGSYFQTPEEDQLKRAIPIENLKTIIIIDSSFSIEIERHYEQHDFSLSTEVSLEIQHSVNFISIKPITLGELKKKAYSFMKLMMLALGKQIYTNFTSVIVDSNELEKTEKPLRNRLNIIYFSDYLKRNIVEIKNTHRNSMLFYGGNGNHDKLNQVIKNWYNSYDEFSTIYDIYLDTFEWFKDTDIVLTEVMFKNRFLNLIQALESYHSLTDFELKNEEKTIITEKAKTLIENLEAEDKKWIIERISPLHITVNVRLKKLICSELSTVTSEFFNSVSEKKSFIFKIKKIRDDISHGNKVILDSNEVSEYYNKTLLILLSCILKNLKYTNEEILNLFSKTHSYSNRILYLKKMKNRNPPNK